MTEPILDIALWLERRLHMSLTFHLRAVRLYGIVVNDPSALTADGVGAARCSFIDEDRDGYALLAGASGVLARSFDAAAIVTSGWAAPLDEDGTHSQRPQRHPRRRRLRATVAVSDAGIASVLRFEDDPDTIIGERGPGLGDMFAAIDAMWSGDPADLVNLRTTRAACRRHA